MKRFLIIAAMLTLGTDSWAQKSTGLIVTAPSANFRYKAPDHSPVVISTYKAMGGIGWYRQKWHKEKLFRAWDIRIFFATGQVDTTYLRNNWRIPEPQELEYKAWGVSLNWKLGTPLFHTEFDDRFLWYATAGVGLDMGYYEAHYIHKTIYGPNQYDMYEEMVNPKFLDLGIGFETRMGKNWYFNMSGNFEVSYHTAASISVRLLRRKTNNFKMY